MYSDCMSRVCPVSGLYCAPEPLAKGVEEYCILEASGGGVDTVGGSG